MFFPQILFWLLGHPNDLSVNTLHGLEVWVQLVPSAGPSLPGQEGPGDAGDEHIQPKREKASCFITQKQSLLLDK